ncbi:hypothetical protein CDAR_262451 [Caerostris darwini]|uniref:Uncharacterized protein n=1 Tax=Caerostris darwini TaxID=1538125 RepID=A0AAV4TYN8_9ARAC|nr:hypothetical protein CDAR_262451 [Caerostris darwini]
MKPTFRADNLLNTLQRNRIIEIETIKHILWKFNPPTASWWNESDSNFVPLSPSLFLQDIKEIVMPDCDAADYKGFNIRIKYRRAFQKDLRK